MDIYPIRHKYPDSEAVSMNEPLEVTVLSSPEGLLGLTPLLREGVEISIRAGRTLRQTMEEDLGFCPECVQERVQTVFLNGSPVDDIDADAATQGCTLALAGALPGVAGIAMRRGSPVGVFREGITHEVERAGTAAAERLTVTLKLFNSVALECLAQVLEQGVLVRAARLQELLEGDADALAGAGFTLGGASLDRAALLQRLNELHGLVRLAAEVAHAG